MLIFLKFYLLHTMWIIPSRHFQYKFKVSMRNPKARSEISTMFKVNVKDTKTISLPTLTAIYLKLMHWRQQNRLLSAVFFLLLLHTFCTLFNSFYCWLWTGKCPLSTYNKNNTMKIVLNWMSWKYEKW